MAASNYMTEEDTESIWDTSLDTTRFGNIGVRIAEILNFFINDDATSQVTNTAYTPICEQLSEEALIELIAAAKVEKAVQPWDFITSNVVRITSNVIKRNMFIIDKIRKLQGTNAWEMTRKTLPSSKVEW